MAWFRRRPKYPAVVAVNFRGVLSTEPVNPDLAYNYRWGLDYPPSIGLRVWVNGADGRSHAVIAALGPVSDHPATKSVLSIFTQDDYDAALRKADEDEVAWLEMARKAAGLRSKSRKRVVPDGYPEIAPVDGGASKRDADAFGRMWWRAYKLAESRGLPDDEVKRLSSLAYRWFAIRDRR